MGEKDMLGFHLSGVLELVYAVEELMEVALSEGQQRQQQVGLSSMLLKEHHT